MRRDEGCLCGQITALLSVFSWLPFPHEAQASLRAPSPLLPPSLPFPMLLFSCKWECCFSVVIPNDKEVCNLNTSRQNPQISTKCPFNAVRKYGEEGVSVREEKSEREKGEGGGACRQIKRGAVTGFQVPSRVVVFDTVIDKVISRGVKTPLLFNVRNDFSGFTEPKKKTLECIVKKCHQWTVSLKNSPKRFTSKQKRSDGT